MSFSSRYIAFGPLAEVNEGTKYAPLALVFVR